MVSKHFHPNLLDMIVVWRQVMATLLEHGCALADLVFISVRLAQETFPVCLVLCSCNQKTGVG